MVTVPASDVSYIVTEYGMVNLKGKSVWERAKALISIAHPSFRDELTKQAIDAGLITRGTVGIGWE
jgi:acyl-CoA hydrolase